MIGGLIWMLGIAGRGMAQTGEDPFKLDYLPLKCSKQDEVPEYSIQNRKFNHSDYSNGQFWVNWGDGKPEELMTASTFQHQYEAFGQYTLTVTWKGNGGEMVSQEYEIELRRWYLSEFRLVAADNCVGSPVLFEIPNYARKTAETQYELWVEGADSCLESRTQQQIIEARGVITHQFDDALCNAIITLKTQDACSRESGELDEPSFKLTVVKPVLFDIEFEQGDNPVCVGIPFTARVNTLSGNVCGKTVKYEWDFEGNDILDGEEVTVPPYSVPGTYKVVLTSSMIDYACATKEAEPKYITVIERAVAGFDTDQAEYCIMGENPAQIHLTDKSSGKDIEVRWRINGASQQHGAGDWTYQTAEQNTYQVEQYVFNSCSDSLSGKTIEVKQDRDIRSLHLPDTLCAVDFQVEPSHVEYAWHGNPEEAHWVVEEPDGTSSTFEGGYPVLPFSRTGKYKVAVHVDGSGCGGTVLDAGPVEVFVVRNEIHVDVRPDKTPERDTIFLCNGNTLAFDNHSTGDNLVHHWVIEPTGVYASELEVRFADGYTAASPSPVFEFSGYGDCLLKDEIRIKQGCNQDEAIFRVHVGKAPSIAIFDFGKDTLICQGNTIDLQDKVYCDWYNNSPEYRWTFEPDRLTGDKNRLYPAVTFPEVGLYTLTLELMQKNCADAQTKSERSVQVRVRENKIKAELEQDPAGNLLCEGSRIRFRNKATDKEGDIVCSWLIEKKKEWEKVPEEVQGILPWTFEEYGDYRVIGIATGYCAADRDTVEFTVHKNPKVELRDTLMCPGTLQLEHFVKYEWYNNTDQQVTWSITGPDGGYMGDLNALYPELQLAKAGDFVLKVEVSHPGCEEGLAETRAERTYHVYDTAIRGGVAILGTDGVADPNRVCEGETVTFNNETQAERPLTWVWEVEGGEADGYSFEEGNLRSGVQNPRLTFSKAGDYVVKLRVDEGCNSRQFTFPVNVEGVPQVHIADVDSTCEPYTFSHTLIEIPNTADLRKARWRINPGSGFDRFDTTSVAPDIRFRAGSYEVEALYWNRCALPGRKKFTVNVDEFVGIEKLRDTAVCVRTEPFRLRAVPDTGKWTSAAGHLILKEGKAYFDPCFEPYARDSVSLFYTLTNRTCVAYDSLKVYLHPLPHVEAGADLEMCLNDQPYPLIGLDSVLGDGWKENQGYWELSGTPLPGHRFDIAGLPEAGQKAGDFRLFYHYTDPLGCANTDSVLMTVHPLPGVDFRVNDQTCRYDRVLFTPLDTAGNHFEWSFGDGSPNGSGKDTIGHVYLNYGWQEVVCMGRSAYGCRDTSDIRTIEIMNLPPRPYFGIDTLKGCAPLGVRITIDTLRYADDHNALSFHWDYGDGMEEEGRGAALRTREYPSGIWDTTYVTRFTVSNRCATFSYDTTLTVYSVPKVSFALMHQWECSPVFLELQNTSTGNHCTFEWTFTNARTGEMVEQTSKGNPTHEFTTDSTSTTYYIHLKAENRCAEDEFTDSLVVKPRSISAHFTPLENPYACAREEIVFRNNSSDTVSAILNTYWNFGDGTRDSVWSPVHAYAGPGTYTVRLKIDNGCGWDTISSPVEIYPLPELDILCGDYFCEADTAVFVLKSDQELSRIKWHFGDGGSSGRDSVRYAYTGHGNFQIQVTGVSAGMNHCSDTVRKEVRVFSKPQVTIVPFDTVSCSPLWYEPRVEGDAYLLWDFGDGTEVVSDGGHLYENGSDTVQRFRVKIIAETDQGCREKYERLVGIYNHPRAGLEKKVQKGNPQQITFINLSEAYTDCIWELPGKGVVHSGDDQVVEWSPGNYVVSLIAENQYLCRDTATLEHEVLLKGLYFPNTFIPHSLNGRINRFNGIGIGLAYYKLEIFDQYNNKLWETRALENGVPSEGWDGCNAKGERMPQGMYIWRAEAIFVDDEVWTGKNNESGVPETTQGTVLLLRE